MLLATAGLLVVALIPLARLRRDEDSWTRRSRCRRPADADVRAPRLSATADGAPTGRRPWTPGPAGPRDARARSSPRTTSRPPPGCRPAPGGSAVDAAIATNAVLGVVMPSSCGIGGDAFWLIWDEATGRQTALNGSGRAPAAADAGALRAGGLTALPRRGPLSITVPGAVRSWGDAHARHGRLSRDTILAPAIELARDGFPAWDGFIDDVETDAAIVREAIGPDCRVLRGLSPARTTVAIRASGSGCRPWPRRSRRWSATASTRSTTATSGERQARGLAAPGRRSRAADLRAHTSTWGDADRHRLPGRPGHDAPAEQLRARRARVARDPRRFEATRSRRPSGRRRDRPGLGPPRHRGGQARDGGPRRVPDRPGLPRGARSGELLDPATARRARRADRPATRAARGADTEPARRRHRSTSRPSTRTAMRSA